ncbi:MAG: hypothetical protein HYU64_18285 [Armatimonadetes bacterium]|nr:hypothetical protein [Armatimonadota bacterium]
MDFSGIENVINRINQIESQFSPSQFSKPAPTSFSEVLQSTMGNLQGPPVTSAFPPSGPPGFQHPLYGFNPLLFNQQSSFASLAATQPNKLVRHKDHEMTAATAAAFEKLEKLVGQRFPGREVIVTSTTDGTHSDPNHYSGKAVDFVVDGMTKQESVELERLCEQAGFKPYNEYIHGSTYKTGDHMHIDLVS